jgi:hypothetical protein
MNRTENPEINSYIYGQGDHSIRKSYSLFHKWFWDNWIATGKWIKLDPWLIPHIKINSKWIKDLSGKTNTIKWGISSWNLARDSHRNNRKKWVSQTLSKLNLFHTSKDITEKVQRQLPEREKICANSFILINKQLLQLSYKDK